LDNLLRELGFEPEDFPEALRTNSALIRYAEDLPNEMRAEYKDALRQFFQVYKSLNDAQRIKMLKQFDSSLQEGFERKRWDH